MHEHGEILDALTRRDGTRLQSLLRDHLANKLVLVMEALRDARRGGGRTMNAPALQTGSHPSASSAAAQRAGNACAAKCVVRCCSMPPAAAATTDASIYQIEPVGVVVPRDEDDALIAMQIALDAGVPVLPRGGGTSQCGQTVGAALVLDVSRNT